MKRRYLLLCAPAIAVFLAAGCASSPDDAQPTAPPETTAPANTATLPKTPTRQPQIPVPKTTAPLQTVTTLPPPLLGNIAVATGASHACSLNSGGEVFCRGRNHLGQLGNGTNPNHSGLENDPEDIVKVTGIEDAVGVATDWDHTCALHETGRVSCWGSNDYGKLGSPITGSSNRPVEVNGINDAVAIALGWSFSCALHGDGTISCWGLGRYGELGNGTSGQENFSIAPVKVIDISDATAIAVGANHACALRENMSILCWGTNNVGELGNGLTVHSSVPVQVMGINDAISISAAGNYSCALHVDLFVSCWGTDIVGSLDIDDKTFSSIPNQIEGISEVEEMVASTSLLCLFRKNNGIVCLGADHYGNLGSMSEEPGIHPLRSDKEIVFLDPNFFQICSVYADTTVYCWGIDDEDKNYIFEGTSHRYIIAPS